MNSEFIRRLCE